MAWVGAGNLWYIAVDTERPVELVVWTWAILVLTAAFSVPHRFAAMLLTTAGLALVYAAIVPLGRLVLWAHTDGRDVVGDWLRGPTTAASFYLWEGGTDICWMPRSKLPDCSDRVWKFLKLWAPWLFPTGAAAAFFLHPIARREAPP